MRRPVLTHLAVLLPAVSGWRLVDESETPNGARVRRHLSSGSSCEHWCPHARRLYIALLMPSNPVAPLPLAATNELVTRAATAAVTKAAAALRPLATRAVMPVATRVATTRAATVTATPVRMQCALKACTARRASHVWPAPPLTHLAEPTKRHTTLRASFATSCVHPLLHFRLRNREGLHERRLA